MKVYTGGTFDLLHPGHVEFLSKCAELGELTVALNRDEFVFRYKNKYPVMPYPERAAMLLGLRSVASVVENSGDEESTETILRVSPNLVAIGSDWFRDGRPDAYLEQMGLTWEWMYANNISLAFIPRITDHSSTSLRQRIADAYSIGHPLLSN